MSRNTLRAVGLLLMLVLVLATGCAGQDNAKTGPGKDAGPGQPGAAAQRNGEEPAQSGAGPSAPPSAAASASADEDLMGPSPWHDGIHYFGIVNAVLAALALIAGLVLFVTYDLPGRKWSHPTRRKLRAAHMLCGAAAIAAGLVHYLGRSAQAGQYFFGTIAPALCLYGFLLLLVSGLLRYNTPRALRKAWKLFPWLHRLGLLVALYYLARHSIYQFHKFMTPGAGGR